MSELYWKKQAHRWKSAYWASINNDSAEDRRAIISKQKAKRKSKSTGKPRKKRKPRKGEQLSFF